MSGICSADHENEVLVTGVEGAFFDLFIVDKVEQEGWLSDF